MRESALIVSMPGVPNTIDPVPPASSRDLETIDFSAEGRRGCRRPARLAGDGESGAVNAPRH